jgi:hypothetical protein
VPTGQAWGNKTLQGGQAAPMSDQYAIQDISQGRGTSPPMDDPGGPLPPKAAKYGASPDVRNAVMDYYKQDKKQTTANLSALMNSGPTMGGGYDDFDGGGESVITLEEFQDLKRAIQTLVEAQASQRRGSRFKVDWKWYHILFLIMFNDLVLIAVGSAIGSAFYNIKPLKGGSFSAGPIEVEQLAVNPEVGFAGATIQSTDDDASLAIRSMSNDMAKISMGDSGAAQEKLFTMQTHTAVGQKPAFMLMEGFENRMWMGGAGGRTDIDLNPSDTGKIYVNRDLSLAKARIGTENSSLTVAPGNNQDLHLNPMPAAQVTVHHDMTLRKGMIGTQISNLHLSATPGKNVSVAVTNGFFEVAGDTAVTGDALFDGELAVTGVISGGTIRGTKNAEFLGNVLFGDEPQDGEWITTIPSIWVLFCLPLTRFFLVSIAALDFKGHFRSCVGSHAGIAGILGKEIDSCDTSNMIFDADDDGAFFALGVPNTVSPTTHHLVNFEADAMCSKVGRPPNFERDGEPASWLEKPCNVLTSESQVSMLQEVGDLKKGNIVSGFGTAEVSGLTSRGASNLYGDATLGISLQNEIQVNGHISSSRFTFDRDGDSVRYIMTFPDPSDEDFQERRVDFPLETGTVLTSASSFSTLEAVGALSQGSLVTGFGAAEVASLLSTGYSFLSKSVQLGGGSNDELNIQAHVTSNQLIFDANSDGTTITFQFPDPVLVSKTISFPDESGIALTTSSKFSTLEALGPVSQGSLVAGFGAAQVASLQSDGTSNLKGPVNLGDDLADKIDFQGHVISETMVFDANSDGTNKLTLFFPDPTAPTLIQFPQENGRLLTTTSEQSTLQEVGDLKKGNIVSGFGDATVEKLTATDVTNLVGGVNIGDDITDIVKFTGRIENEQLTINHPNADGDLTLAFPRPSTDISISFPDETGEVITTVSKYSTLTAVAALAQGTITTGFGDISITNDISTTDQGTITSAGLLWGKSSVQLGGVPEHEITIRGTIEVRGGANTVFSVDPMDGNTFIKGNVEIGGSIQALAAPFFVNAIRTGAISELIDDQGVNIEGIVFKDGGFALAKTDEINEYTEGQGVLIDGVLCRDGGVIAQSALVSANPRGSIDLITAINEGRDYEMIGTISNFKFRQYFQATPDEGSFAVDSAAISVGTESNWNEDASSRDAYMSFSTVYHNFMSERLRMGANGDLSVNTCSDDSPQTQAATCGTWTDVIGTSQLYITQATAHVSMAGNVTIGYAQKGTKRLLINSEEGDTMLDMTAGGAAHATFTAGAGADASLTITSGDDRAAKVRFVDPAAASGATFELQLFGQAAMPTLQYTDGTNVLASLEATEAGQGNFDVTGHTTTHSARVATLLETENFITYGNTTLGDNVTADGITILGHLTHENLTIDLHSDGANTLQLHFPEPTQDRTIEYPDEDGRILTTSSNYSTLTAVGTLIVGALGDGFGRAEVASLKSKGLTHLLSDIDLGDGRIEDGVNINSHIREDIIAYDANSDLANITHRIPDPTPPIPNFDRRCSTWDGTIINVVIGWPYDDVRKIDWLNISETFPLSEEDNDALVIYNITEKRDYTWVNCAYNDTIFCNVRTPAPYSCKARYLDSCAAATTSVECGDQNRAPPQICVWDGSTCAHINTPQQPMVDDCANRLMTADEQANYAACEGAGTMVNGMSQCLYTYSIQPGCDPKAESADTGGYTCADYHAVGYSCNDLVYVFGYNCAATCVTPTLEDDIGIDTGYGWLSLEQSLIDHRDAVKSLIDNAPSYEISFPEETGTTILTQCNGHSKAPGTCVTRLPGVGAHGDIYLGADPADTIYIPGMIQGFFTILGTILTSQGGTVAYNPPCASQTGTNFYDCTGVGLAGTCLWFEQTSICAHSSMFATNPSRIDTIIPKTEALRFQTNRDHIGKAMHIAVAEQTADHWLQLPDETGVVLSSSSSFSTLNTVGELTSLDVAGDTSLKSDVTLGDELTDKVLISGSLRSRKNNVCQILPTCTPIDYDMCKARDGTSEALCLGAGNCSWTAIGTHCNSTVEDRCASVTMTSNAVSSKANCHAQEGCIFTPIGITFTANNAVQNQAACVAQTECSYVAQVVEVPATCVATDTAICEQQTDQLACDTGGHGGVCTWDAGDNSCAATDKQTCLGVTLVLANGVHETMKTSCEAAGTSAGKCTYAYTAPVEENCEPRNSNTHMALSFDGYIAGDDKILHLAVIEPTASHTITMPDESGTILTSQSTVSNLEEVGPLSVGSIVAGFGSAVVQSLAVTEATALNGNVMLGDASADMVLFQGQVGTTGTGDVMVFKHPDPLASRPDTVRLQMPSGLSGNHTVVLPDFSGAILTDQSDISTLTAVAAMDTGSTIGIKPVCAGCVSASGCEESRISEAKCTARGGTYSAPTGFGNMFARELTAVGDVFLEGETVTLGTSAYSKVNILGALGLQQLTVDVDGGGGGKVSLAFIDPPSAADTTITFPAKNGLILLDTSTESSLQGTGPLSTGSIVEGFGDITLKHPSEFKTTCPTGNSNPGCGAPVTLLGTLQMDSSRVAFSYKGIVASDSIVLSGHYTTFKVSPDGQDTANLAVLPGATYGASNALTNEPAPLAGQMLVIENTDNRNIQLSDTSLQDIYPGMTSTYFYMGLEWVETARNCYAHAGALAVWCKCSRTDDGDCDPGAGR